MCGIFAILNNQNYFTDRKIRAEFLKGYRRGPENSKLLNVAHKVVLGFHRLAINGLDEISNQPMQMDNTYLICNGEIYNYRQLFKTMNVSPRTNSDCEVILYLYAKYGMEQTLQMIDGVFAFLLLDLSPPNPVIYIARDPFGVRPLYDLTIDYSIPENMGQQIIGFGSEMKCLSNLITSAQKKPTFRQAYIKQFHPGTYSQLYYYNDNPQSQWTYTVINYPYITTYGRQILPCFSSLENILDNIYHFLHDAVRKRVTTTQRPIACLLSGGLDSSLITALVKHYHTGGPLETYSIGLEGSPDLKYAKIVADFLDTKHTQIQMTQEDFFNSIPEVIHAIESYDTTTVRASVGNYLVAKYISENSKAKVIFNGDGSDEVTGGYMYFHAAPDEIEFDRECRCLLRNIYTFDVLRSDRCVSSHGLEARTPFLDCAWVQYYLSIPPHYRYHPKHEQCEKFLLRKAFDEKNTLPMQVLWRNKEAFSDGVSGQEKSWYQVIDEMIVEKFGDKYDSGYEDEMINKPTTREQRYYRSIFEQNYPGFASVLPTFWMPKYVEATDSSARSLKIYDQHA